MAEQEKKSDTPKKSKFAALREKIAREIESIKKELIKAVDEAEKSVQTATDLSGNDWGLSDFGIRTDTDL